MINLAKREKTCVIDLEDPEAEGLSIEAHTLSDTEAAEIASARMRTKLSELADIADAESVSMEMPYDVMMGLFPMKFKDFVGEEVLVDGEPFDITNSEHAASLPLRWKMTVMSQLVAYAMTLSETEIKNSVAQAQDLLEDTMSSEAVA